MQQEAKRITWYIDGSAGVESTTSSKFSGSFQAATPASWLGKPSIVASGWTIQLEKLPGLEQSPHWIDQEIEEVLATDGALKHGSLRMVLVELARQATVGMWAFL